MPKIGLNPSNFKHLESDIADDKFKYHTAGIIVVCKPIRRSETHFKLGQKPHYVEIKRGLDSHGLVNFVACGDVDAVRVGVVIILMSCPLPIIKKTVGLDTLNVKYGSKNNIRIPDRQRIVDRQ